MIHRVRRFLSQTLSYNILSLPCSISTSSDEAAYCAGDPVNLVDPEGADVWTIDANGNVQWKESSDKHYLHFVDNYGNLSGRFIIVSSAEVLLDLENPFLC